MVRLWRDHCGEGDPQLRLIAYSWSLMRRIFEGLDSARKPNKNGAAPGGCLTFRVT